MKKLLLLLIIPLLSFGQSRTVLKNHIQYLQNIIKEKDKEIYHLDSILDYEYDVCEGWANEEWSALTWELEFLENEINELFESIITLFFDDKKHFNESEKEVLINIFKSPIYIDVCEFVKHAHAYNKMLYNRYLAHGGDFNSELMGFFTSIKKIFNLKADNVYNWKGLDKDEYRILAKEGGCIFEYEEHLKMCDGGGYAPEYLYRFLID